ncbi:MAG: hypothetical protein NUV82_01325 [Candidatus Komeilibacteria bacterium]|nr:hypothetical protein [Candidatus Komeilibacteria bacterium]
MYEDSLSQTGLTEDQAIIYEILLKNGPLRASRVAQKSPLKRALVYKLLNELVEMGLADKEDEPGQVAIFGPLHPTNIEERVEKWENRARNARTDINQVKPLLVSDFNLQSGKPNIRFYEGEEGIKKVWWDTLRAEGEILTYGDLEVLATKFESLNKQYYRERAKRELKKRAITNDSEFNRAFLARYDQSLTETRLIKNFPANFSATIMQIYDNKVSYTTLTEKGMIGLIIDDHHIAAMQKTLFEFNWEMLKISAPDNQSAISNTASTV